MKLSPLLIAAVLFVPAAPAFAAKACEELKTEIAERIDAKGVSGYTLEIVSPDAVGERQVVGSCDGGSNRIVYTRGMPTAVATRDETTTEDAAQPEGA
jgi:hypothetical protein